MPKGPIAGNKGPKKDVGPRQRMFYVQTRIAELRAELDRFNVERKSLRASIAGLKAKAAGKSE